MSTCRYTGQPHAIAWVRGVLHAEFSSLLLNAGMLDSEVWRKLFRNSSFQEDPRLAATRPDARRLTDELIRLGFVSRYAASSIENDINCVVELAFSDPVRLRDLEGKSRLIRRKGALIRKWYASLGIALPSS